MMGQARGRMLLGTRVREGFPQQEQQRPVWKDKEETSEQLEGHAGRKEQHFHLREGAEQVGGRASRPLRAAGDQGM